MATAQRHIRQLNYEKTEVSVVNLLDANLVTKGSRVLEKKVNETHASKTVFGHLKENIIWTCTVRPVRSPPVEFIPFAKKVAIDFCDFLSQ